MEQMESPDCCDALAWARAFMMLVAPVVGVVTWWTTYRLTKRSDRRKELTSKIDKLCGQIDAIHKLAYQYHTSDSEDHSLESEIHVLIRIFAADLKLANVLVQEQMNSLVIGLRRAITLRNFETRDFSSKRLNDPLLRRVDEACEKLKTSIDESRPS